MFIYQNGKVYIQDGDSIVGVNVNPFSTTVVKGTKQKFDVNSDYLLLTQSDMYAKFNILNGESYVFPFKKTGVDKNESINETEIVGSTINSK